MSIRRLAVLWSTSELRRNRFGGCGGSSDRLGPDPTPLERDREHHVVGGTSDHDRPGPGSRFDHESATQSPGRFAPDTGSCAVSLSLCKTW